MASEMTTAEMVCGLKRLADICTREDEAVLLGAAKALTTATARAEKAEALYAKAWEECEEWRDEFGLKSATWRGNHEGGDDGAYTVAMDAADAHDAARKEAGL